MEVQFAIGLVIGIIIGVIITLIISRNNKKEITTHFDSLSRQALSQNSADFIKLANETLAKQTQTGEKVLDGKKQLIDQTLENMKKELDKVEKTVTDFDKASGERFIALSTNLGKTAEQTSKLQDTTNKLQMALTNTKVRGQWGERMAEDVLRLSGFIEGINYSKQLTSKEAGTRPDYTFILPQDLKLNMDVKFPLDNYLHYLDAQADVDKQKYKNQFLNDVRQRINDIAKKEDYINTNNNTVDYALVFIPNEQVYCFINENDNKLLDDSLKNKVILCSPMTLYAILAVIRQAIDNFNLEKTATKMLALFGNFNEQWKKFKESMDKMGRKIEEAHSEFEKLSTTRSRSLERPLSKIEEIRIDKQIETYQSIENGDEIKEIETSDA
jgi:DNA recombination protein RmuC